MKSILVSALALSLSLSLKAQTEQKPQHEAEGRPYADVAQSIIRQGLSDLRAIELLRELARSAPGRLCGSPAAQRAVEWGKKTMETLSFQNVHLEPVTVPHWERGTTEEAVLLPSTGASIPLHVCALGGSIGTPADGITAGVLEVTSFEELKNAGERAKGKIIFFNRPMDRTKINTFEAYGGAVDQRSRGAVEAARAGGVAALVRSMTMRADDVPHTGAMGYADSVQKVPALAVSVRGATTLDSLLARDPDLKLRIRLSSRMLPDAESANVVGELVGSEKPQEVIVVGGHLDSWDKGQGAHDDGSGCVQAMEALRILQQLGLHPKRTIRAVLFMNEEFGLNGGRAYASHQRPGEKQLAAVESDMGGFSPRGFGVGGDSATFERIARWAYLLEPMDADHIRRGGGGADISEMARQGTVMIGLRVDTQRYFDYHHSDNDTVDAVNDRELELGAAALAILVYVLAQEGV